MPEKYTCVEAVCEYDLFYNNILLLFSFFADLHRKCCDINQPMQKIRYLFTKLHC